MEKTQICSLWLSFVKKNIVNMIRSLRLSPYLIKNTLEFSHNMYFVTLSYELSFLFDIIIMMQQAQFELPPNITKNLNDKNQQKREAACKDIETIVSKNADRKHLSQIEKIIQLFTEKYLKSYDITKKISGLEVMPSIINGLNNFQEGLSKFQIVIVTSILDCLNDGQHKIRLTALKSLYYISKTLDDRMIKMFNLIFERLIGKINDMDQVVKNAATFFDKSLQTILTSALNSPEGRKEFNLQGFMEIVKQKLKSKNPGVREYLIKWIANLNEAMSIDLLIYLPDLLEDLQFMVGDKEKSLRTSAEDCLRSFEIDMKQKFEEGKLQLYLNEEIINRMIGTLLKLAKQKTPSYTKLNTLGWFKILFQFFKAQVEKGNARGQKGYFKKVIVQRFDQILEPILVLMGHEEQQVQKAAQASNDKLMLAIQTLGKQQSVNFAKVMPKLKEMLAQKKSSPTSQSALKWMKFMLQNYNDKILPEIKEIIEKLVTKLCDSNVKNVNSIIENTAVRQEYFQLLVQQMLFLLLRKNPGQIVDPEYHPQQILRKFSVIQEGDKFCRSICSQIVKSIDDRRFVADIVSYLNIIIINDKNMHKMRKRLQNLNQVDYQQNFMVLFQAFKYNPSATTSLCLLSKQYELAYHILLAYAQQLEICPKFMVDFCKLATLLESPGFLPLRLKLLQRNDPYLVQALAALLMILPQGKVFNMLKGRLQVTRLLGISQPVNKIPAQNLINIESLLKDFKESQLTFQKLSA